MVCAGCQSSEESRDDENKRTDRFVSWFEFQFQGLYFPGVNIPRYFRMLSQFIVGCF